MVLNLNYRSLSSQSPLSANEESAVLACARSLQRSASAGNVQPLLRGKHLVLLCTTEAGVSAAFFMQAAQALGAHVAQVQSRLSAHSSADEVRRTARMLGRLYDAVECEGLASSLVHQMSHEAGIPVFDSLASPDHPIASLAELLDEPSTPDARHRLVLQAALVSSLS
jgi:ornithine carbamoyltransferase